MPRYDKPIGYRVVVGLRYPGDFGFARVSGMRRSLDEEMRDCERLADTIREKVSKFDDDRGEVEVETITEPVCQHCGNDWSENSPTYNGGCCAADEENNPEPQS